MMWIWTFPRTRSKKRIWKKRWRKGLDEEDLEDDYDEDEGAMLSESQLAGILSGDDPSGDFDEDWDEDEYGDFLILPSVPCLRAIFSCTLG